MAASLGASSSPALSADSGPRIALGTRCNLIVHTCIRVRRHHCLASANAKALISDEWLSLAEGQLKHGRNAGQKHKIEVKREGNPEDLFFSTQFMHCTDWCRFMLVSCMLEPSSNHTHSAMSRHARLPPAIHAPLNPSYPHSNMPGLAWARQSSKLHGRHCYRQCHRLQTVRR
jgi:hypothetical protein